MHQNQYVNQVNSQTSRQDEVFSGG